MEIGSFLELDLVKKGEYFDLQSNIARLNSARAGIIHALRILNVNSIYIPRYICPSVISFLKKKNIQVNFFNINKSFEPVGINQQNRQSAILIVNYFGLFPADKLRFISGRYRNVIIDNAPAFFCPPIEGCYNIYSPRKFFGVPDGCYVIGKDAQLYLNEYDKDYSSETSTFLLKRHEVGSALSYSDRTKNEKRIDNSDVLNMSTLTHILLNSIDYYGIKETRRKNFLIACKYFNRLNRINISALSISPSSQNGFVVPMVYPLVIENETLVENLTKEKIYTGRWWKSVLSHVKKNSFEAYLSRFMVPLPIDQRYSEKEIKYYYEKIVYLTKV